jgi:hypothetical protein
MASSVGTEVKDKAGELASEMRTQTRDLTHEARDELRAKADAEARHLAASLQDVGRQLHAMAGAADEQSMPGEMARQLAGVADRFGQRLETQGFGGTVEELKRFARRKPGVYLLGAFALGAVAGRLARAASAEGISATSSPSGSSSQPMTGSNEEIDLRESASTGIPQPRFEGSPAMNTGAVR